jgi:hypothetical protein
MQYVENKYSHRKKDICHEGQGRNIGGEPDRKEGVGFKLKGSKDNPIYLIIRSLPLLYIIPRTRTLHNLYLHPDPISGLYLILFNNLPRLLRSKLGNRTTDLTGNLGISEIWADY